MKVPFRDATPIPGSAGRFELLKAGFERRALRGLFRLRMKERQAEAADTN
jgi:hypothetical protein